MPHQEASGGDADRRPDLVHGRSMSAMDGCARPVVVSVGSINADVQVRVDRPPIDGGTLPARDPLRTSGGKAANVAVVASRLGTEAWVVGHVGDDDLAEPALAGLRSAGVRLDHVRTVDAPTALSSIWIHPDGDKTIALAGGANDHWPDGPTGAHDAVDAAPQGSVVVVDVEIAPAIAEATVRRARHRGMTTVVDPSPPDRVSEELLRLADHIVPDHREAAGLTGIDASDESGAAAAAAELHRRSGGAAHVKLRTGGCVSVGDELRATVRPPEVSVVDTTGAGDAFAGALAHALAAGAGVLEAVVTAVAAAACSVTRYGSQASYPDRESLAAMRAGITVET